MHPLRYGLNNELHARPFAALQPPERISTSPFGAMSRVQPRITLFLSSSVSKAQLVLAQRQTSVLILCFNISLKEECRIAAGLREF
jgi:Protein of unknown function (DUF3422)